MDYLFTSLSRVPSSLKEIESSSTSSAVDEALKLISQANTEVYTQSSRCARSGD